MPPDADTVLPLFKVNNSLLPFAIKLIAPVPAEIFCVAVRLLLTFVTVTLPLVVLITPKESGAAALLVKVNALPLPLKAAANVPTAFA